MATTSPDSLPYPDDYADPADTPAVLEALAERTQEVFLNRDNIIASKATVFVQTSAPVSPRVGDIWVTP